MLVRMKGSRNSAFSVSNKPRVLFFLLINVKMPTIIVIITFMSRKISCSAELNMIFFITLGPVLSGEHRGGWVVRWCWVNFQCRGVLLIRLIVGQGPTALAVGAGEGCLDIFTLIYLFTPLSPSLWETARYRLKYCLKGPSNPKQPTNQNQRAHEIVKGNDAASMSVRRHFDVMGFQGPVVQN